MTLARRLLVASGGGGSFVDPVRVILNIMLSLPNADAHGYVLTDDYSVTMDTIKAIDDPSGGYFAVYHHATTGPNFDCYLATSSDLATWTRYRLLYTNGDIPTIAQRSDGSFVVGLEDEGAPHRIRLFRYATRATLLSGAYSDTVLLPQTLASGGGAEGTPNFYSADDPMDIGFHYNDGTRDKLGRGTLTGWSGTSYSSWTTAADTGPETALTSAGEAACGKSDAVDYRGFQVRFIEAQSTLGGWGTWRLWYWNGTTAVEEDIATDGGSTSQAVPNVSILVHPTIPGRQVLWASMYLFSPGNAPGEAGPCWWYKALP